MFNEDKTKWSYLAGMVDGEGCISIWSHKSRHNDFATNGKTYDSYNLRVQIYNTSLELMKWLVANFGGVYHTREHANDKHKTSYNWRPKGAKNTEKMLRGMLPYLVIKAEQAKLALKYIELPRSSPREREIIYRRIKVLNQKGKTVTTNTLEGSIANWVSYPEHATTTLPKIESDLTSNRESAPLVTVEA